MDIDLVYTWVDGSDEQWKQERNRWCEILGVPKPNECRYYNNDELKYSLRSVFKNAPWINNIFIVTNGQVPKWLDTNHPKIQIVNQNDIMPEDASPSFNSNAIEACIQNIKDLSEHFLYANDDFFIYKNVSPEYFFTENGEPIIRLVKQNWGKKLLQENVYCAQTSYCIDLIEGKYGIRYQYESSHNMTPYRKSYYADCMEIFPEDYQRTVHAKFRIRNCLQRVIVSFRTLALGLGKFKEITVRNKFLQKRPENIFIGITTHQKMNKLLTKNSPFLFCINDNELTKDEDRANLKSFLEKLYPETAPWEKDV